MKKILPFTVDVEMRAYHNLAFPLGIFKASIPNYDIWLCNKLINSIYYAHGVVNSYDEDLWSAEDGLTSIRKKELKMKSIDNEKFDIVQMNKEMLKEGIFVHGTYDEYYIKSKSPYNKYHYMHDYIIFGFDDKQRVFKSAAYLSDGGYDFYDIEYDDYYHSIIDSKVDLYVNYVRINKEYLPQIDIVSIKNRLMNYLHSKEDSQPKHKALCFGMEAWEQLRESIISIGEQRLDNRYSRVYMEHRFVMRSRIEKLCELNFLSDFGLAEEYYDKVCLLARATHLLFIKYNLTRNPNILPRIVEVMQKANENEMQIISRILCNKGLRCI